MPRLAAPLAAALAVLTPAVARADVLPPPTLVLDSLYLGAPGIAVLVVLVAAAVLTFRALRRRGWGLGLALGLALVGFVVADLVIYGVLISQRSSHPPVT
ncbi:MAG: hypothetical protein R3B09_29665 [Nannocystaceae bacterium]